MAWQSEQEARARMAMRERERLAGSRERQAGADTPLWRPAFRFPVVVRAIAAVARRLRRRPPTSTV